MSQPCREWFLHKPERGRMTIWFRTECRRVAINCGLVPTQKSVFIDGR